MTTPSLGLPHGDPFAAAMQAIGMPMVITDPRRSDNPIVFANKAFLDLTGYSISEVMGRNCRFLQGPGSDPATVEKIRWAATNGASIAIDILNYRKDGSSFHNALHLSPVLDEAGDIEFFVASQTDVTDHYRLLAEREQANRDLSSALELSTTLVHEIDHRVKNNLQMVSAMILLQSLDHLDPQVKGALLDTLSRVEALSSVHSRLHQSPDISRFDIAACMRDLLGDLVGATGRDDIRVTFDLISVEVPAVKSAALALLFNEVFTNALKHAFLPAVPGSIRVTLACQDAHLVATVADDGVGIQDLPKNSFGLSLISTLARQLEAEVSIGPNDVAGTRVEIRLPR